MSVTAFLHSQYVKCSFYNGLYYHEELCTLELCYDWNSTEDPLDLRSSFIVYPQGIEECYSFSNIVLQARYYYHFFDITSSCKLQ